MQTKIDLEPKEPQTTHYPHPQPTSKMPPHYHLCSKIENAFRLHIGRVHTPNTRMNRDICQILYNEGFLTSMSLGDIHGPFPDQPDQHPPLTSSNLTQRKLWLELKYRHGQPVLTELRCVSKPSRKVFASALELQAFAAAAGRMGGKLGNQHMGQVTILNTVFGIIDLKEALKKDVGGEVLCYAF